MITGLINQRIEILKKTTVNNEYGGGTDTFTSYWETSAEAKPLRSSRTLEANQSALRMVVRFKVRARDDKEIYNDMLVKWRGQTFIIQNYSPDVAYKTHIEFDGALQNSGNIMEGTQETT